MTELSKTAALAAARALSAATSGGAVGRLLDGLQLSRPLVPGETILGRVLSQGPQGRLEIASELGQIKLETSARLAPGMAVVLHVRQVGGTLVITVFPAEPGAPGRGQSQDGGEGGAEKAPLPESGRTARPSSGDTPRPAEVLARGEPLRAVLLPPERAMAPEGEDRTLPRLPFPLAYGREVRFWISAFEADGPSFTGAAPREGSQGRLRLPARVSGTTGDGRPIIALPLGRLVPSQPLALPGEARLLLEIETGTRGQPLPATPMGEAPQSLGPWRSLEALLAILKQSGHHDLLAPLALPKPGPGLAGALLRTAEALARGDAVSWIGSAALASVRERAPSTVESLERDFTALGKLSREESAEWRVFLLPLLLDNRLDHLRLFISGRSGDSDEQEDAAQRFRIEMEFAGLGPLQLDGLVMRGRFDLVLRSRRPFSEAERRDLEAIFREASALAGAAGALSFDASERWRRTPLPQTPFDGSHLVA